MVERLSTILFTVATRYTLSTIFWIPNVLQIEYDGLYVYASPLDREVLV